MSCPWLLMPPARAMASSTRSPATLAGKRTASADLADDADHGVAPLDDGHNRLRLESTALQGAHDRRLNLLLSAAARQNPARVRHGNHAFVVDDLIGNGEEVARPQAAFEREEEAAGGRFVECHADHIANADLDASRRPAIAEPAGQPLLVAAYDLRDGWADGDQAIGQLFIVTHARRRAPLDELATRAGGGYAARLAERRRSDERTSNYGPGWDQVRPTCVCHRNWETHVARRTANEAAALT